MSPAAGPQVPAGVQLRCGDALDCLRGLETGSVQAIVTSPPYYRQRNYGAPNELGLERTPAEYVGRLAGVFDECFRVLADDGNLWLNLGDTYASRGRGSRSGGTESSTLHTPGLNGPGSGKRQFTASAGVPIPAAIYGRPPKSLLMIPSRVAIELQDRGWILRQDNIWRKMNTTPESAKDRTTGEHEHVFHFVKQTQYRYNVDAVAEPARWERWGRQTVLKAWEQEHSRARFIRDREKNDLPVKDTRNLRNVWTFPTGNYPGAHFAVMPDELADLCIRACTKPGDTVLDPFMGAGTTLKVALEHGCDAVGIDADPKCVDLTIDRLKQVQGVIAA